jgi:hypothetical protein
VAYFGQRAPGPPAVGRKKNNNIKQKYVIKISVNFSFHTNRKIGNKHQKTSTKKQAPGNKHYEIML